MVTGCPLRNLVRRTDQASMHETLFERGHNLQTNNIETNTYYGYASK